MKLGFADKQFFKLRQIGFFAHAWTASNPPKIHMWVGLGTWNIVFLNSLKKTEALQKNHFSSSEKLFFFAHAWTAPNPHKNQYAGIGFCVDCEQSKHARKNNFSELEKLFFCKACVFFKLLRKTMFQVPKPMRVDLGTWNIVSPNNLKKTVALHKINFSSSEKLFFRHVWTAFNRCLNQPPENDGPHDRWCFCP